MKSAHFFWTLYTKSNFIHSMILEQAEKGHGYCCPVLHVCNPNDHHSDHPLKGCPPINQVLFRIISKGTFKIECDPSMEHAEWIFKYWMKDCITNPLKRNPCQKNQNLCARVECGHHLLQIGTNKSHPGVKQV